MKLDNILTESDLDWLKQQLKQAGDEVDSERQSKRSNFSEIEGAIRSLKEFNTMLDVIADKVKRKRQKPRGASIEPEINPDLGRGIYDKMVRLGLLNEKYGLTDKAYEYFKWVQSQTVKDNTRKYPDRYKQDTIDKLRPENQMGNFPPKVRSDLDRMDAKKTMHGREDGDSHGGQHGEARNIMLRKVRKLLPLIKSRLDDRERPR